MKAIPEFHQQGTIMLENLTKYTGLPYIKGDLGIQVASDGRVWICIDGVAFIRFSPYSDGKMRKNV